VNNVMRGVMAENSFSCKEQQILRRMQIFIYE
jgi:hypothetical protein